jgi:hypothetical protein
MSVKPYLERPVLRAIDDVVVDRNRGALDVVAQVGWKAKE